MKATFRLIVISALALVNTACENLPVRRDDKVPLSSVAQVDLLRYQGLWYNLANYPNGFQDGCSGTTATYELQAEQKVRVINRCLKNGELDEAVGTARAIDATGAKLKVRFFPLAPEGDYWVIALNPEYTVAAIGEPSGKYLWVISRRAGIAERDWLWLQTELLALGYDLSGLIFDEANFRVIKD